MVQTMKLSATKIIDDDALVVEVIPAYHPEDLLDTPESHVPKYLYWLFRSKNWLYFAYVQSAIYSIVGIILPFFYAGAMTSTNQVYWIRWS